MARRPRDGFAIFRLYRIGESIRLLVVPIILAPLAVLFWSGARDFERYSSSISLGFAVLCSVIAGLVFAHSLRTAFTSEALLWEHSAQCFHWIRKTPFSKRTDTLGVAAMSAIWVVLGRTDDEHGGFYYTADVSIRRHTGEEWLRVAYYCPQEAAMHVAQELSSLTGRPSQVRSGYIQSRGERSGS